ncbi:hypothetical protein GJ496_002208 [Pomphorhynchus laevis]|nr:hypothetical protein GJ496_002208 [Pomphorhynchus laevis]
MIISVLLLCLNDVLSDGMKFHCGNGHFVDWTKLCDGYADCHDSSDERLFCNKCIDGLYRCDQNDTIHCEYACKYLNYIPCKHFRDHQACKYYQQSGNHNFNKNY